jgi:ribosomal-protein-alanine N-acetyltransferase
VTLDDALGIAQMMTPAISRWVASWPEQCTAEIAAEKIRAGRARAEEGDALPLVIVVRDGNLIAGWLGIYRDKEDRRRGAVGYWLGEVHQGKGYLRELMPHFLAAGYAALDLDVIEAMIQPENAASIAVIEGSGMRFVGEGMHYAAARQRDERCLRYELRRPPS